MWQVAIFLALSLTPEQPAITDEPSILAEVSCQWYHAHPGGKVRPYFAWHHAIEVGLSAI